MISLLIPLCSISSSKRFRRVGNVVVGEGSVTAPSSRNARQNRNPLISLLSSSMISPSSSLSSQSLLRNPGLDSRSLWRTKDAEAVLLAKALNNAGCVVEMMVKDEEGGCRLARVKDANGFTWVVFFPAAKEATSDSE